MKKCCMFSVDCGVGYILDRPSNEKHAKYLSGCEGRRLVTAELIMSVSLGNIKLMEIYIQTFTCSNFRYLTLLTLDLSFIM